MGLTTLPPSCDDCIEIWEPQCPVQASTDVALPFGQECTTLLLSHQNVWLPFSNNSWLVNQAVNGSESIASNGWMIDESWAVMRVGGSDLLLI